jgi:flagellar hook protein FlgE
MGLYGLLTTSASGMSSQSALLNAVSDNIANVDTVGYKKATTEFSSMVLGSNPGDYQSGSVKVAPVVSVDGQGNIKSSTTSTNLAIQGNGFFVVQGTNGQPVLTRAGAFAKNSAGYLVNSAGFDLLGYKAGTSGVANGYAGLTPINLNNLALQATPTTSGKLYVNLNSNAQSLATTVPPGVLPSANLANSTCTDKTSLVTFDNLGNQVALDVYFANNSTSTNPNQWDIAIYNAANATNGGFPYTTTTAGVTTNDAPLNNPNITMQFNGTTGALTSPTSLTFTVPNGKSMTLDMAQTTQLATGYTILKASADGNAPSPLSSVDISPNGLVSAVYQNGSTQSVFTIPLATVPSPDKMTVLSGNVFLPNLRSGAAQIGAAGSASLGEIQSSSLEASTVDLANELTTMIQAQNNYQADSKVFNTGSQLLQVLINLGK